MIPILITLALCWLIGFTLGLYLICLAFASWLDNRDNGMIIEHEGQYMSLKRWYDNFVDKK